MRGEILRRGGRSVTRQIGRARDHHAPILRQPDRYEAGVRQLADADRAVDALVHQIHDAIGEVQRAGHVRIHLQEFAQQRRDVQAPEAGRRGHADMAARLHTPQTHRRLGIGEVIEDALAILEEGRSLESQRNAARRARHELDAQALLQRVEPAADDRRGDALRPGRCRKAPLDRDTDEGFDLLERIHFVLLVKDQLT